MVNEPFTLSNETKERMNRARILLDRAKLELEKAKRAGLTDIVATLEPKVKEADSNLRKLESVYR